MDICQRVTDFGNEKLGHMWGFTVDDVLKVLHALILYCIECGAKPDKKELEEICLRTLEWQEADGAVKIITHTI